MCIKYFHIQTGGPSRKYEIYQRNCKLWTVINNSLYANAVLNINISIIIINGWSPSGYMQSIHMKEKQS